MLTAGKVAKITTSGGIVSKSTAAGAITEYTVAGANSRLGGITGGPDGRLWFTEGSPNKVAAVVPGL